MVFGSVGEFILGVRLRDVLERVVLGGLGEVFADTWWDCRKLARRLLVRIRWVMG